MSPDARRTAGDPARPGAGAEPEPDRDHAPEHAPEHAHEPDHGPDPDHDHAPALEPETGVASRPAHAVVEHPALTSSQARLLGEWVPGAVVEKDMGWGLIGTTVLRVRTPRGTRLVVKAGDAGDHHIAREIRGHGSWTGPWVRTGHVGRMLHADPEHKVVVLEHLPGRLVEGHPAERDPATYRQAGELLAALHAQAGRRDTDYEARENRKILAQLDAPHRIPAGLADHVRHLVRSWPAPASVLVPTHGDYQPRNWLVDQGTVRVIDLGRFALRPAEEDLWMLHGRAFESVPGVEAAFIAGYGRDPREPGSWARQLVRRAVATAVWAHRVGAEGLESEGIRLLHSAVGR